MSESAEKIFKFEKDFQDSLRCIPMAVRMALDLSGIKLSLKEWLRLSEEERQEILRLPCDSQAAIDIFFKKVQGWVRAKTGGVPETMPPVTQAPWQDTSQVPTDLIRQASESGLQVPLERWASLSDLQRFALIKLSRPHHRSVNFLPAMQEFGLCA